MKNRTSRLTLLAVSIAAINVASNTYAQEDGAVEELQVWGTQVRASSLNLLEENIALRQADHISDLLRTIPGVDVGGAHALNQRITIRSMDDKDLRISIDGANQNTYMYHHMGNLHIHADILQSVDVEIGSNSVINGGLGGAVRFETKRASQLLVNGDKFGLRVQANAGDNSGSGYAITGFGQVSDTLDFLAYYNSVERDNYEVGGGKLKDSNGVEVAGTDGEVKGLEGEMSDMLLKLGWDIASNQRLEIGYERYADEGHYSYRPDMGLATDLAITNSLMIPLLWPTKLDRETLTLNYDLDWGGHSNLKASLYSTESELDRDESGWASSPSPVFASFAAQVNGKSENTGLSVLGETVLASQTLTYGVDLINYDTDYNAVYAASVDAGSEKASNKSAFIQDRIDLGTRFSLIPGLRYDSYDLDSTVVDDTFSKATAALAAEFEISDSFMLKLSATQLFKGPEIGEVFIGAGLFDTANPDIKEETGINTELALAYEDSVLGAERFTAGITFFQTDIRDYIYDYATPPPSVGGRAWKDNVGDMTVDGLEAYLGYDLGSLSAMLTYSKAESDLDATSEYSSLNGARLDRQQGDSISLNVDYQLEALSLALHWDVLRVDHVGSGLDLDGATLDNGKDGYLVHNISARWVPASLPGLTLIGGIDNLFDEYYSSQSSRTGVSFHPRFGELYLFDYEPGRNIKVTASYQF